MATLRRLSVPGANFCEGPQRAPERPKRPNTSSTSTASGPKLGGMFVDPNIDSTLGAGLQASLGLGTALTMKALGSQHNQRPADEPWIDGSRANESVTADATSFEDYEMAPCGDSI